MTDRLFAVLLVVIAIAAVAAISLFPDAIPGYNYGLAAVAGVAAALAILFWKKP
jgi:hypothetical protein